MNRFFKAAGVVALALGAAQPAAAFDWSDTSVGYRYGTKFAEPYNPNDIHKHIVFLTHADGYQYGGNYMNLDVLKSDDRDDNATEAYLLYRHTLDVGKVTGHEFKGFGLRGLGLTAGFDINHKNDKSYASRKRMLVAGPTLMVDVPGFLNVSLLAIWESNAPIGVASRYHYDTHAMLNASWGIPLGGSGWSFEGYVNYIGSKGRDEFGGPTGAETNLDMQVMYDCSSAVGLKAGKLKAGFEYQYWRNKFGNPSNVPGSLAQTPMVRAEYHF
ncbi:outer envelope protein [Pseudoduganella sp. RAF53_2]|uniref:outer envelope protein n=1 Tax=unclassified Pseudoduganella TaxID=2637179 RepID=UPI003F9CD390